MHQNIGPQVRKGIVESLESLLEDYERDLNEAYDLADEKFQITFKIEMTPAPDRGIAVTADISFTKGVKMKDRIGRILDEQQQDLPLEG